MLLFVCFYCYCMSRLRAGFVYIYPASCEYCSCEIQVIMRQLLWNASFLKSQVAEITRKATSLCFPCLISLLIHFTLLRLSSPFLSFLLSTWFMFCIFSFSLFCYSLFSSLSSFLNRSLSPSVILHFLYIYHRSFLFICLLISIFLLTLSFSAFTSVFPSPSPLSLSSYTFLTLILLRGNKSMQ
jgi:hypothetical protein